MAGTHAFAARPQREAVNLTDGNIQTGFSVSVAGGLNLESFLGPMAAFLRAARPEGFVAAVAGRRGPVNPAMLLSHGRLTEKTTYMFAFSGSLGEISISGRKFTGVGLHKMDYRALKVG
jgi:hypothetical protein